VELSTSVLSITVSRYEFVVSMPGVVLIISSRDVEVSRLSVVNNSSSVGVSNDSVVL